ncbi:MAG: hypothetical protein KAV83_07110 [Desulfobacterales bacterium]|nr:hypothetical protein [Desulfobacterales bacterium]
MAISSPGARPARPGATPLQEAITLPNQVWARGATLLSICYSFCGLYLPRFSSANVERAGLGQGLLRFARNDSSPNLLRSIRQSSYLFYITTKLG